MAVLEMLPEMIRSVELLGRVAFPELVHLMEVATSFFPVAVVGKSRPIGGNFRTRKVNTAVAAGIGLTQAIRRFVERALVT